MTHTINSVGSRDARFPLPSGAGVDAVHTVTHYAYAVALLESDHGLVGSGIVLTLGTGNDLVCSAIDTLGTLLLGKEIEELMADFGKMFHDIADHPLMRWLGPHKGVVHLALAALTNACFDLWAKSRGVPLWRLLLDLSDEQIVALLDLSYVEDVLSRADALSLLDDFRNTRQSREGVIAQGYPGYDTSIGWFGYPDDVIRENAKRAVGEGFSAMKLKVGSADPSRDIRRAKIVREAVGDGVRLMLDANQQWSASVALRACLDLAAVDPFWIEEPTHPDDVIAHQTLARAIHPVKLAVGEHIPNRVVFKNYLQSGAAQFYQVDCTRVGGVSEFITVSLMARKRGFPVVPHVGDMGQIHQHLVLFNHVALDHERIFLEYIPHLKRYFSEPAQVKAGVYVTPQRPGSSSDLK